MDNQDYFEQPYVWSDVAQPYQVQVAADIADLIPDDVTTVLDVGSGNGLIVRDLPARLRCVGLDQSLEALQHNPAVPVLGSADRLPFADNSFDLVMSTDMLEHVEDVERCVAEMARVSARYMIIAVPYEEDLASKQTWCGQCARAFHINHHLRRFTVASTLELAQNAGWPVEVRLSGGQGRPRVDELAELRASVGAFLGWTGSRCPSCGAEGSAGPASDIQRATLDAARELIWWQRLREQGVREDRSEIVVLFDAELDELSVGSEGSNCALDVAPAVDAGDLQHRPLLEVQVGPAILNSEILAKEEFIAGQQLPSTRIIPSGDAASKPILEIAWPCSLRSSDLLIVCCNQPMEVELEVVDGVLGQWFLLQPDVGGVVREHRFALPRALAPTQFGALVRITTQQVQDIGCVQLLPGGTPGPDVVYRRLQPGNNVLRVERGGTKFSWGLLSEEESYVPDPLPSVVELASDRDLSTSGSVDNESIEGVAAATELSLAIVETLSCNGERMSALANDIEKRRARLDEALKESEAKLSELEERHSSELSSQQLRLLESQKRVEQLNELANALEAKRAALEVTVQEKDRLLLDLERRIENEKKDK